MDRTFRENRGKHARGQVKVLVDKGVPRSVPNVELGELFGSDDEWVAALEAFPEWAAENLWIDTKGGDDEERIQLFVLNFAQRQTHDKVVAMARAGLPIWVVIPKARQTGVSTYCQGLIFYLTYLFDHLTADVVAHTEKAVKNVLRKTKVFYTRLPDDKKLKTLHSNTAQLEYAEPHGSRIIIAVCAGGEEMGQSFTLHLNHWSEISLWGNRMTDPTRAWDAIVGAVPKHRKSVVFAESSPQGRDELLYPLVQSALGEDSEFVVIFLPWYIDPGYTKAIKKDFERTDEERILCRKVMDDDGEFGGWEITDEQLNWRRSKIATDYRGNKERFRTYFPTFLSDCFATTERAFFDPKTIDYYRQNSFDETQDEAWEGEMGKTTEGMVEFVPVPGGPVTIYKPPQKTAEYVIGADTSDGIPGRDASQAYVIKSDNLEVCASIRCRVDGDEYAEMLGRVGAYYNWAMIAPERNRNPYVTQKLWHEHGYPNLYWMPNPEKPGSKAPQPGWHTNKRTRPLMLECLKAVTREKLLINHDQQFPEELATFVYNNHDRNYQAAPGKSDDRVMAMAIACELIDLTVARGKKAALPEPKKDSSKWFRKRIKARQDMQRRSKRKSPMVFGRTERWPTEAKT